MSEPKSQTPRNFQTLQCGRGLAALAVVLFHSNLTLALPKYFAREPAPLFISGFSGVYYFFVLSGAVMVLAHKDQIGRRQSPWSFFIKRFNRIYLPLWAALIFTIPLLLARISLTDIVLAFSAVPAREEAVLAIEWTLRHEILFYLFFGILLWRPLPGIGLLALWFGGSILALIVDLPFPASFILSPLHLLFAAGMIGAVVIQRNMKFPGLLAAIGTILFVLTWAQPMQNYRLPFEAWAAYGIASLLMIVGFARMEISHRITTPRILRKMGDASYSIYLIHFAVISVCAKVGHRFDVEYGPFPLVSYFVATAAVALTCGFIFYYWIEAPLVRWAGKLRLPSPA